MSITVEVGLLSGRTATVQVGLDEEVGTLKRRSLAALGVDNGRLLDPSGSILDDRSTIKKARVQNEACLTLLHACRVQVCGSRHAFAAIMGDRSIVTWGNPHYGGDSSAVRNQLENVTCIQATGRAFAALLADGSVVTWGDARLLSGKFSCNSN